MWFTAVAIIAAGFFGYSEFAGRERIVTVTRDGVAMDTYVSISVSAPADEVERTELDAAMDDIFELLSELNAEMALPASSGSDLSSLNDAPANAPVEVPRDLFSAIETALEMSEITGGAFDPTIGAVTSAWRPDGGDKFRLPSDDELAHAMSTVGRDGVVLTGPNTITKTRRGVRIDLGGFGKGYASSRVLQILRTRGASSALVDMGGNIALIGGRPDGENWRIGIQEPSAVHGTSLAVLSLSGQCVITAGLDERWWELDGVRYSHIYDPTTGRPITGDLRSVTVVCEDPMMGDALSTAFMVLGVERSFELLRILPAIEAVFVTQTRNGTSVVATDGLRDSLKMVRKDARLSYRSRF